MKTSNYNYEGNVEYVLYNTKNNHIVKRMQTRKEAIAEARKAKEQNSNRKVAWHMVGSAHYEQNTTNREHFFKGYYEDVKLSAKKH